jgi:SAM-dependent methyltransferase
MTDAAASLEPIACAVCGGHDTRLVYRKFDLPISRCRACGLVYATPRLPPEQIWKRYSSDYFWKEYLPALGVRDGSFDLAWFDAYYAHLLALIRARVQPGRLLEVGAGAGFFLKAAERAGWAVSGVELSPDGAAFAHDRLGLDVRRETAEAMSFPPRSFDVAVMFDVVEHLLDPLSVAWAVHGALKPDGFLFVTTPNVEALSRLAFGAGWSVLSPGEHLFYFSEGSLRALLERAGFSDVTYERGYARNMFEAMNPLSTHAPRAMRARVYRSFIRSVGPLIYAAVARAGRGDTLVCAARA